MIIIPIKWLFHWEYTLFSDKPISWSNFPNRQTGQFRRLLLAARDPKRRRPTDSLRGEAMTKGDSKKKHSFIELDDGKIYRKALYLMEKTMVSCRFSLKPIQWFIDTLR